MGLVFPMPNHHTFYSDQSRDLERFQRFPFPMANGHEKSLSIKASARELST